MARITYIEPGGQRVDVDVTPGLSVMQGAMNHGVHGIEAQCGGMCSCATCHCYVQEPWVRELSPPSGEERVMLMNVVAELRPNSRLSCQLRVTAALAGLVVEFPDRQS